MLKNPREPRFTARDLFGALLAALVAVGLIAPSAYAQEAKDLQWYLESMKAEEMWKTARGDGVTVAVIDSGVDRTVPELRGQVAGGKSFLGTGSPYRDPGSHGTTIAALISGTGKESGIHGLAPESKILALKTTDEFGIPGDMAAAINHAIDVGAKIINVSLGASQSGRGAKVQKAIDRANKEGVLIFASSGNAGDDTANYPAALPGVVAVAATDKQVQRLSSSQYGQHVSLSAPGGDLAVRCKKNTDICKNSGTSAASALASASAALIWSKYPDWTANQVLRVLIETAGKPVAGKIPSKYIGYGAVRPRIALADDSIDPGDPDKNPLFSKYYAKQEEKSDSSEEPDDGKSGSDISEEDQQAQGDASEKDSNSFLVPAVAVGAVAVLGAALAAVFLRRRTRVSR
ncbi:S8 family serine peptidase [Streptomyces sp. P38-E01]|uniref:S8 family serine peptidase n=1 Tax=Streptomyces tardus TaxID=2780544 RepID=A0A949JKP5_9ACTN|nr:S8 family serine peptidase [Streptomyces tardus]MBU7600553.1 S8 family serine peptidase [Streptomyces tardus]